MENKVIENKIEVNYKVKVGDHFVRSCKYTGSEEVKIQDYSLSNEWNSNTFQTYNVALQIAKLLKGTLIEITTTKIVLRNEKEVKVND